jgi:hypothetical protein
MSAGIGQFSCGNFSQRLIQLDGDDLGGALGQSLRQRAGAAADFENNIVITYIGRIYQQPHQVQIDEEILAKPFVRLDARR